MKMTNKAKGMLGTALLVLCVLTPGIVGAQDGPINVGLAIMLPGQSKSFVASSDMLPDIMIIPLYLYGTGVLNISISESSPETNLFMLLQRGTGYPNFTYRFGTSPRTMSATLNIYDQAWILIVGSILYSPTAGPYQFTVSLNFN